MASGTNPMSYQWQRRPASGTGFTDVSGAIAFNLLLANAQPSANGDAYRVIVTNAAGSVTSGEALLNVQGSVPAQINWTQIPSGTSNQLLNGQFIDANNGWVVGENGIVLKTTNGGLAWSQITTEKVGRIVGVQFVNVTTGWLVGAGQDHGVTVGTTTTLYSDWDQLMKTTDGGQTWTDVRVPGSIYSGLYDVAFLDVNTGWVVGEAGRIFKTIDGGTTWTDQSQFGSNMSWRRVRFVDALHGWVAGSMNNVAYVMRTVDGGNVDGNADCAFF